MSFLDSPDNERQTLQHDDPAERKRKRVRRSGADLLESGSQNTSNTQLPIQNGSATGSQIKELEFNEVPPLTQPDMDDDTIFCVLLPESSTFRALVNIAASVLSKALVKIVFSSKSGFQGIMIKGQGKNNISMLVGQLDCTVRKGPAAKGKYHTVILPLKEFNATLKSKPIKEFVEIEQKQGTERIVMRTYNPSRPYDCSTDSFATLAEMDDLPSLQDLKTDYYVELEYQAFNNIIKTCQVSSCNTFRLKLEEPIQSVSNQTHHFLTVQSREQMVSHDRTFHSTTCDRNNDTQVIMMESEADTANNVMPDATYNRIHLMKRRELYSDLFNTSAVHEFLKPMDKHRIMLFLGSDMPLIIHYPLGNEKSFVRFVVAPSQEDVV